MRQRPNTSLMTTCRTHSTFSGWVISHMWLLDIFSNAPCVGIMRNLMSSFHDLRLFVRWGGPSASGLTKRDDVNRKISRGTDNDPEDKSRGSELISIRSTVGRITAHKTKDNIWPTHRQPEVDRSLFDREEEDRLWALDDLLKLQ
ncbi:hypothetical protein TNCV_2086291 [Trichonephila clavipes]|nr:hypothetical protein TNCV_2086291 [Trichonephila clavipes]